jgi:hypothetical protein
LRIARPEHYVKVIRLAIQELQGGADNEALFSPKTDYTNRDDAAKNSSSSGIEGPSFVEPCERRHYALFDIPFLASASFGVRFRHAANHS